jgi:hypothetical protein
MKTQVYHVMTVAPPELLDRNTSRSICDAVGERLQRDLQPDSFPSSSHIEHLLETMSRQERDDGARSSGDNRKAANLPVSR